jgi:uncharacterized protein (TIGR04255 family)
MTTLEATPIVRNYVAPPIIEVVYGLTFEAITQMLAPHIGLLWERYRPEFVSCQEAPQIIAHIEKPGGVTTLADVTELPSLPRVQFRNGRCDAMIQIQRDRFHYNWQRVSEDDDYPHFTALYELYETKLSDFRRFVAELDLGSITPTSYELTYVNHIPAGNVWTSVEEVGRVFPDLQWRRQRPRLAPESIQWRSSFWLPEQTGRLHVAIRSAKRMSDEKNVFVFELTVRSSGDVGAPDQMSDWFRKAHDQIVIAFEDLTEPAIQQAVWGRTQ